MNVDFLDDLVDTRPLPEIRYSCMKKEKAMYVKYYPTDVERKEIIKTEGDGAFLLFEYYLRMASFKDAIEPTDQHAAEYFSWDQQKVKRNRLKLTKSGWLRASRYQYTDNRKGINFYVGKDAVRNSIQ